MRTSTKWTPILQKQPDPPSETWQVFGGLLPERGHSIARLTAVVLRLGLLLKGSLKGVWGSCCVDVRQV